MHRIVKGLGWRVRHATVPLLLPGLVLVLASALGQALNVAGVNVPALTAGASRWATGGLGVLLIGLALVVGVPPPARLGGVRGAWPQLPPHHVPRPELQERLWQALHEPTDGQPCRVGVCGMGGSGKSVLAAALGWDSAVRRRFPDGLAWVRLDPPTGDTAARPSSLIQKQQELIAKLNGDGAVAGQLATVEQGRDRLAEVLRGRRCLLVIDNVWTTEDVHAFDVLDRRGALVLTTRDAGLARRAGAVEVEVAELTDEQARQLAAGWARVGTDALPKAAAQTLRLVGNLALGVATVAAQAEAGVQRWPEFTNRLRAADLAALQVPFPGYPHQTLLAALQLGLDCLGPSERQRYRELAVFAGRGPVPRSVVEALWTPSGMSGAAISSLLTTLQERALLSRDPVTDRIDLHDLQFDVVRADLDAALPAAHEQLLAGYAARCPRGWPSGPDDGYFFQHLAEHLAAAGRHSELTVLLGDIEWMRSRLAAGGVTGLLADYTILPNNTELALVQATIRLSAHVLAIDPDQLPAQLAGRTIGRAEPVLARLHAGARTWPHTSWLEPLWPTLAQPGEGLQQTLTGHGGRVLGVAVSADGSTVVSGAEDGTVRVWQPGSAAGPRVLTGHTGSVWSVAVSADGATVVSGGKDGTVRVWQPGSAAGPRVLTGHTGSVWSVAVSADGATVVSGGEDGTVRVWQPGSAAGPRVLTGHTGSVWSVAVSADGATVVSGGEDGTVRVWEPGGFALPEVLTGHTGWARAVAVSADGATVVSGGEDGTVRVWRPGGTTGPWVLTGHTSWVLGVAVSADGSTVVSGGEDGTVRVLEPGGFALPEVLTGHTGWVRGVAVSADGATVVSGGEDGTVRVWRPGGTTGPWVLTGHTSWVLGVAVSADGATVVSGGEDGTVRVWRPGGTSGPEILTGHTGSVRGVAVSADGATVVSGGEDGTVRVWRPGGTTGPRVLTGHTGSVRGVAVSADGATVVSGGEDGTVRVWRPGGTTGPRVLTGHTGSVRGVAVSADGATVVSGGEDGTVRVWRPGGTSGPEILTGHTGSVRGVAVSADGATVVSGGEDGTVRVWRPGGTSGPEILTGHTGSVRAVAVSADGATVVSGGEDGTVRVWDVARSRKRVSWIADARVTSVALTAMTILAGDAAGQVHALRLQMPAVAPV
ncbi:NB-ARC domain-containing protein [Geodermatophilus sp. URMC 60]